VRNLWHASTIETCSCMERSATRSYAERSAAVWDRQLFPTPIICESTAVATQWYVRGIRLLGRTLWRCTRDSLGIALRDVASVAP